MLLMVLALVLSFLQRSCTETRLDSSGLNKTRHSSLLTKTLKNEIFHLRRRRYTQHTNRNESTSTQDFLEVGKEHISNPDARFARSRSNYVKQNTKKLGQYQKTTIKTRRSAGKRKRFVSNLKNSLKKHLKNRHGSWALSHKEADKLFQTYYQCITDRVKLLKAEEFPIKAFMAIESEKVLMECKICYRPDYDEASQRAVWQVLGHEATDAHAVVLSDKIKVLKDNTLLIKDIDVADAGQYYCVEQRDYMAIYQLDVFLEDKRRHLRVGTDEPRAEEFLFDRNLRVYTTWAAWSDCNSCDRPGRRHRVGQCTVKKIYADLPIFPRDYPLMVLYPDGVPCHSTALPRHIRQLPQVGDRESETIVLPCMELCPTEPPTRVVTDKYGEVLDVLEPGFYSIKEKPLLPPLVQRKVFYEPENSNLVLMCPGGRFHALDVHWTRGERTVDPAQVSWQTRGRVWLDIVNRLHFKALLLSDTAVYK